MVSCASALDDVNLHKNSLDFMHQGISASGVSSNQDSLDPFEVNFYGFIKFSPKKQIIYYVSEYFF